MRTGASVAALGLALLLAAAARAQEGEVEAPAEDMQPGEQPEAEPEQAEAEPDDEPTPPNIVEANERVERGERLFEQGDYDAALAEFERAYELVDGLPSRFIILYNIGQAHERRFRYDLAMRYYRRYLDEGGPDAPDRPLVEASIRALEGLLATVHVSVNVPEAEVWVNDRQIGTAPGDVLVPGGRHVIEVRAPGYVPARREIQVAPRTEETVELALERLAEEYHGLGQGYFWTASALAVVALGVGASFGVLATTEHSAVEDRLGHPTDKWLVTQEDLDRVSRYALIADVAFGAAALFGGGAILLAFLTDWGAGEEEETAGALRVTPSVSASSAALSVGGRF